MAIVICPQLQKFVSSSCIRNVKRILPPLYVVSYFKSESILQLNTSPYNIQQRFYSEKKEVSVQKERPENEVSVDVKTVIKETTKTVSYTGVILIGIGVTGALFYAVFRELFSSKSPSGVYSQAFKKCCGDTRVQDALGVPIKGHGEETSRGRRRHVSHLNYVKDGVPHIRMIFYLKGSRNNGTVYLDMKENSSGDLEYRYIFVQLDDYTRRVIILEDNRALEDAAKSFKTPLDEFNSPLNLDSSLEVRQ